MASMKERMAQATSSRAQTFDNQSVRGAPMPELRAPYSSIRRGLQEGARIYNASKVTRFPSAAERARQKAKNGG
jgi:hypothetical protein